MTSWRERLGFASFKNLLHRTGDRRLPLAPRDVVMMRSNVTHRIWGLVVERLKHPVSEEIAR